MRDMMRAIDWTARTTVLAAWGAIATVAQAVPVRASAFPTAQQLDLSIDVPRVVLPADSAMSEVVRRGVRMPYGAMLYRFRMTVTDTSERPVDGARWEASVMVGELSGVRTGHAIPVRSLATFTGSRSELTLPSPLGYRLEDGDSIVFVATFHVVGASAPLRIHLIVDFEPLTESMSRIAVMPRPASRLSEGRAVGAVRDHAVGDANDQAFGAADDQTTLGSWEWAADFDGRVLAIVGLPVEAMSDLVLEDRTTGERLWSGAARGTTAPSYRETPSLVVRMGILVTAGHLYRITAAPQTKDVPRTVSGSGSVMAMVLPAAGTTR